MSSFSISQWAEEDKPREKLMAKGPAALSDSELLAILIGSGSTKESAVGLMQRILADCDNNLNTLGKMSLNELMSYNGIGEAKAITISPLVNWASGDRLLVRLSGPTWVLPWRYMSICCPRCKTSTPKRRGYC